MVTLQILGHFIKNRLTDQITYEKNNQDQEKFSL